MAAHLFRLPLAAYWDLVTARLASLQEQAFDSRITIGGFLERRLRRPLPPINQPSVAAMIWPNKSLP